MVKLTGKLYRIYERVKKDLNAVDANVLEALSDSIKYFGEYDPSATHKYVDSMVCILLNENKSQSTIADLFRRFHSIENKLQPKIFNDVEVEVLDQLPQKIFANPKDIGGYETYKHFDLVYQIAINHTTKKDRKNVIVEEESDIIYDGNDYLIVTPITFESSCYWGVETKWCTTSRDNPSYFSDYIGKGSLFYVIDKYRQNEISHPLSKFAIYLKRHEPQETAEVYNRPDQQLARGIETVLPPSIVKILVDYHFNGGTINIEKILNQFAEYGKNLGSLDIGDNWRNTKSKLRTTLKLVSINFPSYAFFICFNISTTKGYCDVTIKWVHINTNKIVATCTSSEYQNKILSINVKRNTLPSFWFKLINEALDKKTTYISIKKRILEDVIQQYVLINFNANHDNSDNWNFSIKDKKLTGIGVDIFTGLNHPPSITDLGIYNFFVSGPYADLLEYKVSASLNFVTNEFILLPGETDEISWDDCREDFNLLYYNEIGVSGLLEQFKKFVITTLTTKSKRIMLDIYDNTTLKMTTNSSAFEDYLNDTTERKQPKYTPTKSKFKDPKQPNAINVSAINKVYVDDNFDELLQQLAEFDSKPPIDDGFPLDERHNSINLPF